MGGHDDAEHDDAIAGDRKAELDRREAALEAREAALTDRMDAATDILAAADRRDAIADARNLAAENRENDLTRAEFIAPDEKFGNHWPERREAGLDREHATSDRAASHDDRIALTRDGDEPEAEPEPQP
jgi:uncharacterized protein (DUF3084 family)